MKKIEVKHSYLFPIEKVFKAFITPDSFKQFMFRTESGVLSESILEAEVGGTFRITEKRGSATAEHNGTFLEIDEPSRIGFIFSVAPSEDGDYVEISFQKTAQGCEVFLTQDLKPEFDDYLEKVQSGWTKILQKLDHLLNRADSSVSGPLVTKDSQGQALLEGDSVKTIKDLKVKGSSMVIKRGTIVKKIHLISGNDEEVDCKVDGVALALETQWLVKV